MKVKDLLHKLGFRAGLKIPKKPDDAQVRFDAEYGDVAIYANRQGWGWLAAVFAAAHDNPEQFVIAHIDPKGMGGPLSADSAGVTLVDWDWSKSSSGGEQK